MDIHILGGFLGSGKTTLLMKLVSMYSEKGTKVSIIVNEAGSIGVDGTTIKGKGYNAIELPEGCICCTLVSDLQQAITQMVSDYHPDVILIEPTGLAIPYKVKETLELLKGRFLDYDRLDIIGILDGPRYDLFISKKAEFYKNQLMYSDMLAINKMDLTKKEKIDEITAWAKAELNVDVVIPVCALTGENVDKVFAGL